MQVLVPFDARDPKSRLGPTLDASDREAFSLAMLGDVTDAIERAGHRPTVLSNAPLDVEPPVRIDDRPLTLAVNAALDSTPMAVVMADLALVTPRAITRLIDADGDIVLAPGLGGGTNALVTHSPAFRVDYHDGSYRKHRRAARDVDATVTTVDSFRLAMDIDEPEDLGEVLLHGEGRASTWLREAGFALQVDERGVGASRE